MIKMIEEAHQVQPWLQQTFPNIPQGFYIYGVEDS